MARLEELIDQIGDPELRHQITHAIAKIKRSQNFGLVFEEHIPETTTLDGLPVIKGSLVQRRDAPGVKALYRVASLDGGVATLEPVNGTETPHQADVNELLVVKRIGEPIYPALRSIGAVRRGNANQPHHAVINGENYHALQLLCYLYEGQVDCIYIDPPYNKGARDWKYNNHYVDKTDQWRHSKWLSFIEKRLRVAKRLLKSDGVLIVTIDENEVHHLGMLLEQLFPEYRRHMITIVNNPKGTNKENFARVDEYALFCCPKTEEDVINRLPSALFDQAATPEKLEQAVKKEEEESYEYRYLRRRGQESGYRHQRPNQFYAILVDEEEQNVVGVGPPLEKHDEYEVERKGSAVTVYPLDTRNDERVWRYTRDTMLEYIENGDIVVTGYSKRTGQGWVLNHRVPKKDKKRVKTVWWERRHDAGAHGSDLLTEYLGEAGRFPFPKSVYAVRDCLDGVVRNREDALILDFFAGSGTTLHATSLLNVRDNKRHQCVLVTNNEVEESKARELFKQGFYPGDEEYEEHGIFESVTRPRSEALVTGRRLDGKPVQGDHVWANRRPYSEGFDERVEFFRLEYLDPDEVDLGRQFNAILPSLWLAAGGVGPREEDATERDYSIPEGSTYGVLFRESRFRQFKEELAKHPEVTHVYLVTDSPEAYAEMRSDLSDDLNTSMLYRDYLQNFRVKTEDTP